MTLPPNPPEIAVADDGPILLPTNCSTVTAEELKVRLVLSADFNGDMAVDASAVETIGQSVLQLLIAAQAEALATDSRFEIHNPSPAFRARIDALGLSTMIGMDQTEELQS